MCAEVAVPIPFFSVSNRPSEVVTGLRRIFSVPAVYRLAQRAIGAEKLRRRLVDEVLGIRVGMRILDLGCGPADILTHFPDVDYVGFDHSENYIESARARFGDRGQFFNLSAADVNATDFAPRDLAISIGVLHHLNTEEAIAAIETARAVLGDNGRFVSVDPTFATGQHPIGRLLAKRDRGQFIRTPDETRALVSRVFDDVTIEVRHDMLHVPYSHVLVEARLASS